MPTPQDLNTHTHTFTRWHAHKQTVKVGDCLLLNRSPSSSTVSVWVALVGCTHPSSLRCCFFLLSLLTQHLIFVLVLLWYASVSVCMYCMLSQLMETQCWLSCFLPHLCCLPRRLQLGGSISPPPLPPLPPLLIISATSSLPQMPSGPPCSCFYCHPPPLYFSCSFLSCALLLISKHNHWS